MDEIIGAIGIIGVLFAIILIILTILTPIFIYSAQKYAYLSHKELKKINNKLDGLEKMIHRHLMRKGISGDND